MAVSETYVVSDSERGSTGLSIARNDDDTFTYLYNGASVTRPLTIKNISAVLGAARAGRPLSSSILLDYTGGVALDT